MPDTFETLKKLLVPYAKHFSVTDNTTTDYGLDEDLPHYVTQFAHVRKGRGGVKLYFYPVKVFKKELAVPGWLDKKKLKSATSVFKLDALTAAQAKDIRALVASSWKLIAARRKANPAAPYCRSAA